MRLQTPPWYATGPTQNSTLRGRQKKQKKHMNEGAGNRRASGEGQAWAQRPQPPTPQRRSTPRAPGYGPGALLAGWQIKCLCHQNNLTQAGLQQLPRLAGSKLGPEPKLAGDPAFQERDANPDRKTAHPKKFKVSRLIFETNGLGRGCRGCASDQMRVQRKEADHHAQFPGLRASKSPPKAPGHHTHPWTDNKLTN